MILSIIAGLYARKKRLALNAASTEIEGHSIDSLNIANLKRRVNRTLVIQEAHHTARIEGEDLEITWQYSGYCKADRETSIDFSIDSDDSTAFENLNCVAFDLARDPGMVQPDSTAPCGIGRHFPKALGAVSGTAQIARFFCSALEMCFAAVRKDGVWLLHVNAFFHSESCPSMRGTPDICRLRAKLAPRLRMFGSAPARAAEDAAARPTDIRFLSIPRC